MNDLGFQNWRLTVDGFKGKLGVFTKVRFWRVKKKKLNPRMRVIKRNYSSADRSMRVHGLLCLKGPAKAHHVSSRYIESALAAALGNAHHPLAGHPICAPEVGLLAMRFSFPISMLPYSVIGAYINYEKKVVPCSTVPGGLFRDPILVWIIIHIKISERRRTGLAVVSSIIVSNCL